MISLKRCPSEALSRGVSGQEEEQLLGSLKHHVAQRLTDLQQVEQEEQEALEGLELSDTER